MDVKITIFSKNKKVLLLTYEELFINKTGLQHVSRPVELVHYVGGWVEGASKQRDLTNGGWVQSIFGAKAEQINRQTDKTGNLKKLTKSDVQMMIREFKTVQKVVQKCEFKGKNQKGI